MSHPTWVRGLKLNLLHLEDVRETVAPYVGAWIETLNCFVALVWSLRRTLRGCVD